MRCNSAGVLCHRKGQTVVRNETEISIEFDQALGKELISLWAETRVEPVLPRPTTNEAALQALFARG
jgi:hypothetical protein